MTPPPLLMIGFEGTSLSPSAARLLADGTACGIVLFARNVEGPSQVRELCRQIRAAAPRGRPAPLVAVDHEGGRVQRLKGKGFTVFPPARSYSLFGAEAGELAFAVGAAMAREVRGAGIDINFAPVLDVDTNPAGTVIGDRALSGDPATAARLGVAFCRGTLSGGILPVGKHFPGHGHSAEDSHEELPVVRSPADTIAARDLPPFRAAIRAGIPALMTAHVLYPALDASFPATLSETIVRGLLRRALRFRGTVFTDALEMRAIADRYGIGEAAVRAVAAGCDVVLICRGEDRQEEAALALARAHRDSPAFRRAARDASRRVERLRTALAAAREEEPAGPTGARRPAARPGAMRGRTSLPTAGSLPAEELAARLSEAWGSTARTSGADRSDNIGEG